MPEQPAADRSTNAPKLTVGSPATLEGIAASLQALEQRLGVLEKQHAGLLKAYQDTVPRLLEDYKQFIGTFNDSMDGVKEFEQAIVEAFNGQAQSVGQIAELCRQNFGVLQRALAEQFPEVHTFAELEEAGGQAPTSGAGPHQPHGPLDLLGGLSDRQGPGAGGPPASPSR